MTVAARIVASSEPPAIPRLDGRTASDAGLAAALLRDGAVVLENALALGEVATIEDELAPFFDAAPPSEGQFYGRQTKRFGGLFAKARSTWALPVHEAVLPAIETVLRGSDDEPRCDSIDLSCAQAIGIGPGQAPQFMHRDDELWPFQNGFEVTAIVMWTLTDFTRENGATRIIPGSHLWPRDREPRPGEAAIAEAPAGSAIIWLGGTLHGGGGNVTTQTRRGIATAFKLGWLAPQEKLLLTTPPELVRAMPERLQRLIGYQVHRPALGLIEGRDPLEWLRGQTGAVAASTDNFPPGIEAMLAEVNAQPERYIGFLT